jgi:hypothetical protein
MEGMSKARYSSGMSVLSGRRMTARMGYGVKLSDAKSGSLNAPVSIPKNTI